MTLLMLCHPSCQTICCPGAFGEVDDIFRRRDVPTHQHPQHILQHGILLKTAGYVS